MCEILKALFNLTLNAYGNCSDQAENDQCQRLVVTLRMYLLMPTQSKEKSIAVKNNIVNLLTNIPNAYYKNLITPIQPGQNVSNKFQYDGQNMTAIYEMLMFLKAKLSEDQVRN